MIQSLLQRLLGHPAPEKSEPDEDVVSPFHFYQTFSLKDGHLLVQELEKYELPFEVELNDGIDDVNARFGSGGDKATLSLYIEDANRDVLKRKRLKIGLLDAS
mgnify:CR=1 FL=1